METTTDTSATQTTFELEQDCRIAAIRALGDLELTYYADAMTPRALVETARAVAKAFGREPNRLPADAERSACLLSALLSPLNGIASDHPALVAQAGPALARRWRCHLFDLGQYISRALRPIGRVPATLPDDVRHLLDVARGKA